MHDETVAIHGGYTPDSTRAVAVPIYQTIAHEFDDAAYAGAVFDLETPGFHYNRLNNPTNDVLEHRIAALEKGTGAVVLSSGAAAVNYSILNLASVNDNIVTAPQLYGSTYTLFAYVLPGQGIEVRFAEDDRPESIERLMDANTKAVFCESVGNPALNVVDLEAVSDLAAPTRGPAHRRQHDRDAALPEADRARCRRRRPFADEVHRGPRHDPRRRGLSTPGASPGPSMPTGSRCSTCPSRPSTASSTRWTSRTCPTPCRCRTVCLRNTGSTLSPLGAFLLVQGLETLAVRLERHELNTLAVARFLADDPRVAWLSYLGDPGFPYFELAQRYLKGHCPSIVTFGVAGGYDAGIRFFDSVKLFKRLVNMGDAKSLVAHPAVHHAPPAFPRSPRRRGRGTGDDPAVDRDRARGRPHRRHRPGAERGAVSRPPAGPPAMAVGVDVVTVDEVEDALARFGDRYLRRIFTDHEVACATGGGRERARHLAARFAAKEATMKALGPGDWLPAWRSIEVRQEESGRCSLRLSGHAGRARRPGASERFRRQHDARGQPRRRRRLRPRAGRPRAGRRQASGARRKRANT